MLQTIINAHALINRGIGKARQDSLKEQT